LIERSLRPENVTHNPEEPMLQVAGKRRHRQAGDDVICLTDTPVGQDCRQVANITVDDLEVGMAPDSAKTRVIGPVPAPNSTITRAAVQSMFRTVVRDSQGLLGARLAMVVPCFRNLPRNSVKSLIVSFYGTDHPEKAIGACSDQP
jgi:hypothetical protein